LPARIPNYADRVTWRHNHANTIRANFRSHHHHHHWNFWQQHPHWARWNLTRPYRWATWAAVTSWFPWGWSQPVYYDYGNTVYYQGDNVYYNNEVIATTEQYAEQAEDIATSVPETIPQDTQWMSLGIFALTEDGDSSGADPTIYLQLAISKEGIIGGTVHNTQTEETSPVEGMVDQKTQRAAWVVSGKTSPIMETGIVNLTKDEAPALLHFADGQTQQWLMVRLEEPQNTQGTQ